MAVTTEIHLHLTDEEAAALQVVAAEELRGVEDQAHRIVREALYAAGVLVPTTVTTVTTAARKIVVAPARGKADDES